MKLEKILHWIKFREFREINSSQFAKVSPIKVYTIRFFYQNSRKPKDIF